VYEEMINKPKPVVFDIKDLMMAKWQPKPNEYVVRGEDYKSIITKSKGANSFKRR
jgi:hypothetical protein